jgi:hypothetical protein
MVSQQASAMEWVKQGRAEKQEAAPAPQESAQEIRAIAAAALAREQGGKEQQLEHGQERAQDMER